MPVPGGTGGERQAHGTVTDAAEEADGGDRDNGDTTE